MSQVVHAGHQRHHPCLRCDGWRVQHAVRALDHGNDWGLAYRVDIMRMAGCGNLGHDHEAWAQFARQNHVEPMIGGLFRIDPERPRPRTELPGRITHTVSPGLPFVRRNGILQIEDQHVAG